MNLDNLSDDELRKASLMKNKKGNATSTAMQAQRILHQRSGGGFMHHNHRKESAKRDYNYGEPDKFTKRFR